MFLSPFKLNIWLVHLLQHMTPAEYRHISSTRTFFHVLCSTSSFLWMQDRSSLVYSPAHPKFDQELMEPAWWVFHSSRNREKRNLFIVMANMHSETQDIYFQNQWLYLQKYSAQMAFPPGFAGLINNMASDLPGRLTLIVCYSSVTPSGTVFWIPPLFLKEHRRLSS